MSIYVKDPQQKAQACVIWMHGLGSDAENMMGLADELPISVPVRHVFLDAPVRPVTLNNGMPMRAWYDILGTQFTDRQDRAGIFNSEQLIGRVLETQRKEGFADERIFLAGFSQGAAMALFTGLRVPNPLGGIIALSGYLPLAAEAYSDSNHNTPVFIASGEADQMVLPAWTMVSVMHLRQKGYHHVTVRQYPMDHAICMEEIRDVGQWISDALTAGALK